MTGAMPTSVTLPVLRIAIVLSILGLCQGGPSVSIASIFAKKKPRVLLQGLQAFPPEQGGNSALTNRTVSAECHWDVVKYAVASATGQLWAVAMLDSDGEIQAGILNGNFHWLGNYAQCMSVKASGANVTGLEAAKHDFDGRYCRAYYRADKSVFSVGMCVPSTCSKNDVRALVSTGKDSLPVFHTECSIEMHFWKDWRAITATVVLLFFGVLILVATFVDFGTSKIKKSKIKQPPSPSAAEDVTRAADTSVGVHDAGHLNTSHVEGEVISHPRANDDAIVHSSLELVTIERFDATPPRAETTSAAWRTLCAFSLYRNVPRITSARHAPGSYTCLHGLRVILAAWIVLGHSFDLATILPAAAYNSATKNTLGQFKLKDNFQSQVLSTYNLAVDGFFLLSAALVTVSFSKHLSRQGGMPKVFQMVRYYVHRYLRLTPAYAVLIMLAECYYRYVAVGPLAPETVIGEPCRKTWWSLLLYIDVFVANSRDCVGWTWYLTLDFQYYVIAPLFVWLLYRCKIFGGIFLFLGYAGSLTARLVILRENLSYVDFFRRVYVQPWTRFGPYAIGIALGMIMYRTKCKVRMPKSVVAVGWLFAISFSLAAAYGRYKLPVYPSGARHAYKAMSRDAFALGIGWLVFACCTGYGGFVNRFLSWNFFLPFSRLTYSLYLIHPLIIYAYSYGRNQLIYVQYSTMMMLFLAYWLLGNLSASVLSACFELPFMELEKVIFSRRKT